MKEVAKVYENINKNLKAQTDVDAWEYTVDISISWSISWIHAINLQTQQVRLLVGRNVVIDFVCKV